jgi:hypothetical protein
MNLDSCASWFHNWANLHAHDRPSAGKDPMKASPKTNRALPSNERRRLAIGHYDYTSSHHADWRPWGGLYDHKYIPLPSKAAFNKALDQLNIDSAERRATLLAELNGIAVRYWEIRRGVERPPLKWYREHIKPVRSAARRVVKLLERRRRLNGLDRLTRREMGRPLMTGPRSGGESEPIQQLLEQFIRVCDKFLGRKDRGGARKGSHILGAARQAANLWEEVSRAPVPQSFDIAPDEHWEFAPSKRTFTYPGPLFVQTVLQGIDPALDITTIRTALRNALSERNKQES